MKHIKIYESFLNEAVKIPKFKFGFEIVEWLDTFKEFKKYRNSEATYDETYFEIPYILFNKVTGLDKKAIEKMDDNLDMYEGSIMSTGNTVWVTGGA